jgi:hypothetical protein
MEMIVVDCNVKLLANWSLSSILIPLLCLAYSWGFYFLQHAYRDGRLEEVTLRHLDCDDGSTLIAKNIRYVFCFLLRNLNTILLIFLLY